MIIFRLHKADLIPQLIRLGTEVCVVTYVLDKECYEPSGEDLRRIGLHEVDVSEQAAQEALEWRHSRPELTVGDVFSAAAAREQGYALATHDGPLRELCQHLGLAHCGISDVLLTLAESQLITKRDIERFKKRMYQLGCDGYRRETVKKAHRVAMADPDV